MRRLLFTVVILSVLILSCGIPNYFSYSSTDFYIENKSSNSFSIYVDPSVVSNVNAGNYTDVDNTPFLYLMYMIRGVSDYESSAKSRMNSYFGGKLLGMITSKNSSLRVSGTIDDNTVYFYLMPFTELESDNKSTFYLKNAIDFSSSFDTYSEANYSFDYDDGVIIFNVLNGLGEITDSYNLVRFNNNKFSSDIDKYKADKVTVTNYEFDYDVDIDMSSINPITIDIYAIASFAFKTYTNRPYAAATLVAKFVL